MVSSIKPLPLSVRVKLIYHKKTHDKFTKCSAEIATKISLHTATSSKSSKNAYARIVTRQLSKLIKGDAQNSKTVFTPHSQKPMHIFWMLIPAAKNFFLQKNESLKKLKNLFLPNIRLLKCDLNFSNWCQKSLNIVILQRRSPANFALSNGN